jgi:hypothetical protein
MSSVTTAAPSAQEHSDRPARHAAHAPDWHRQMIREAAYFRAEARGFGGGDPVEDWLAAEAEIDALVSAAR